MEKYISEEVFDITVKQLELFYITDLNLYIIPECNTIIKYEDYNGIANIYGFIPLDFGVKIYDEIKEKNIKISNNCGGTFSNPTQICFHPDFKIKEVLEYCEREKKDLSTVFRERIDEYVKRDFNNCYLNNLRILSREALIWFVNKIRKYYLNCEKNITLDLIKRTDVK